MAKAKGPKPSEFLTRGLVPQRAGRAAGDRRLDQRPDPSDRDRASHQHKLDLDAFDQIGREVPVLVDLKPSGDHYMEHFHHAGGVPKLMEQLGDLIDLDAKTITGATLRDVVATAEDVPGQDAIRAARQSDQEGRRRSPSCTAISRRAAPSSSSRRRARSCCSTPAARSCSNPSRT